MREPVVSAFQNKAIMELLKRQDPHVRSPTTAESPKEVRLICAGNTKSIMAGGGPTPSAPIAGNVFKDALIDN
jgi:hypothetical protein